MYFVLLLLRKHAFITALIPLPVDLTLSDTISEPVLPNECFKQGF
jgi:hypothetical protein